MKEGDWLVMLFKRRKGNKNKRKFGFIGIEYIFIGALVVIGGLTAYNYAADRTPAQMESGAESLGDQSGVIIVGNGSESYKITNLNLLPSQIVLEPGDNYTINTQIEPTDVWNYKLDWSIKDPNYSNIFDYESTNGSQSALVTAKNEGTGLLTVKTTDGSAISKDAKIVVSSKVEDFGLYEVGTTNNIIVNDSNDSDILNGRIAKGPNDTYNYEVKFDDDSIGWGYKEVDISIVRESPLGSPLNTVEANEDTIVGTVANFDITGANTFKISPKQGGTVEFLVRVKDNAWNTEIIRRIELTINYSVSGQAVYLENNVSDGTLVYLYPVSEGSVSSDSIAQTTVKNGRYTLESVPNGTYQIAIMAPEVITRNVTVNNNNINDYLVAMYSVTYNLDGGKNDQSNPNRYLYGKGITSLKNATKGDNTEGNGFTFLGWTKEKNSNDYITAISASQTGNISLYANYRDWIYQYRCRSWGSWSGWQDAAVSETSTRDVNTRTVYRNWGSWSGWQDAAVSETSTRDVNTRTVYRNWGSWSGWQNSAITATSTRQVDTQWIDTSHTEYRYRDWIDTSGNVYTTPTSKAGVQSEGKTKTFYLNAGACKMHSRIYLNENSFGNNYSKLNMSNRIVADSNFAACDERVDYKSTVSGVPRNGTRTAKCNGTDARGTKGILGKLKTSNYGNGIPDYYLVKNSYITTVNHNADGTGSASYSHQVNVAKKGYTTLKSGTLALSDTMKWVSSGYWGSWSGWSSSWVGSSSTREVETRWVSSGYTQYRYRDLGGWTTSRGDVGDTKTQYQYRDLGAWSSWSNNSCSGDQTETRYGDPETNNWVY